MDITAFTSSLKDGSFGGVYLFAGEEDYLVRYYLKALREKVAPDDAFAVFNNPVFDGEEIDFSAIAEAIKAPPMMSDYKLIEWRHADLSSLKESESEALEALIELQSEYDYSIVAFTVCQDGMDFGTPKKPSTFVTRFGENPRKNSSTPG